MYNVPTVNAERNPNLAFWLWLFKNIATIYPLSFILVTLWRNDTFRNNFDLVAGLASLFQTTVTVGVEWLIIRYFFPAMRKWLIVTWLILVLTPLLIFMLLSLNQGHTFLNMVDSFLQFPQHLGITLTSVMLTSFLPNFLVAIAQSWLFKSHVERPFRWFVAVLIATTITMAFTGLRIYTQIEKTALLDFLNRYGWLLGFTMILIGNLLPALVLRQFVRERNQIPALV